MRISMRSAANILLLATLAAAAPASQPARTTISDAGGEATDRLKSAISRAQASPADVPDPKSPAPPSPAERQQVEDALAARLQDKALDRRARDALVAGDAAIARERERQAKALRQALGLEPQEADALAKAAPRPTVGTWVPVLFASSSMPLAVLRRYALQLERVHGVIALRGMPGGLHKVSPMARLTAQILRLDPRCEGPTCAMRDVQLIVDPILFRQHGVARVPALAMIPGDPTQPYCERDDEAPRSAHLVFGDSALSGLLDEYARLGGAREVKDAQALLAPR